MGDTDDTTVVVVNDLEGYFDYDLRAWVNKGDED